MVNKYEFVEYIDVLPIRISQHTVDQFPLHWHPELEVLLVLKGTIQVTMRNEPHTLRRGELLVVSPGVIHATRDTEDPNRILALQINCGKFCPHDSQIDSEIFDCMGNGDDDLRLRIIRRSVCGVFLEMEQKKPGYLCSASAHVHTILTTLLRHFPHRQENALDSLRAKDRERMNRITGYINDNYASRVTLAELAAREYLTVNYLSTFIHKTLGMSFAAYLNTVRMKNYMELMQSEEDMPLQEISERSGFSSPQYASGLFQQIYGTTPGKYRRQLSQRNDALQGRARVFSEQRIAPVHLSDMDEIIAQWNADSCSHCLP